jgi:DNA-binding MarR family transcriptional regulator/GNAT superfamily N-acetyltransferase
MCDFQTGTALDRRVAAVRAFNRFYTNRIGALQEGYLQSRFSLTEARVLYELAQNDGLTATRIGEVLDLDAGYLSRMLRRFEREGLLVRKPSRSDRRRSILALTNAGRDAFLPLDERSRREVAALLSSLPEAAQEAMVRGMGSIARLLSERSSPQWTARHPAPGDIGWVIERHGALYAEEYGFNSRFEAFVARVAGAFLEAHDPVRERCWIAERGGVRVGSVFVMRQTDDICKLRLMLLEPSARGLGIGKSLVAACIAFARDAGYRRMTLWTQDILVTARGIYSATGFQLASCEPHRDFGPPMVGEEWELEL